MILSVDTLALLEVGFVELVIALFLCLFFVVLVIVGMIYSEMDKHRARACVFVRHMKDYLDAWVLFATDSANRHHFDPISAERLHAFTVSYYSCKKTGKMLEIVPLVNSMISSIDLQLIVTASQARNDCDPEIGEDDDARFELLRTEYNKCAKIFNSYFNKRIPAVVGKLFRMHSIEELGSFSRAC